MQAVKLATVKTIKIKNMAKEYIGTYNVVKIFKKSGRREILRRGLSRNDAAMAVSRYPDSNTSMVVFVKQFTSDKYYK